MRSTDLILGTILIWSFSEGTTIYKEVLINATMIITCIPNEAIQIQWHHTAPGRSTPSYLYAGGRFFDDSSKRGFRLEKDSNTGPYHLVIPSARVEDVGLYECKEDPGSRVFGSTQLTVLESSPVCKSNMKPDGYIGQNTCQIAQEEMIFTCAVSFNGEAPQMTWKILNVWRNFSRSMCTTENGHINCSLFLRVESMYDGTTFNCQSIKSTAECSTEVIKIYYFESQSVEGKPPLVVKNISDKVNCSVKSNQNLKFNWTREQVNVTNEQELSIQSPGLYRCVVEYAIRNLTCYAHVTDVNVQDHNTKPSTTLIAKPAVISVIIALLVIIISVVIGLFLWFRTKTCESCKNKCGGTNNDPGRNKEESNPNPEVETSLIDQSRNEGGSNHEEIELQCDSKIGTG